MSSGDTNPPSGSNVPLGARPNPSQSSNDQQPKGGKGAKGSSLPASAGAIGPTGAAWGTTMWQTSPGSSRAGSWQPPTSSGAQGSQWSNNYPGPNWKAPAPMPSDPHAGSSDGSSLNAFSNINLSEPYTTPAVTGHNPRFFGSAHPSPLGPSPAANSTPGDFYLSVDHTYIFHF